MHVCMCLHETTEGICNVRVNVKVVVPKADAGDSGDAGQHEHRPFPHLSARKLPLLETRCLSVTQAGLELTM